MPPGTPWPRDAYERAVWASDLRTYDRIVALAYADHARNQAEAWVTLTRLSEVCRMSRDAANRAVRSLESLGWLTRLDSPRNGRAWRNRAVLYGLTIPAISTGDVPIGEGAIGTGGRPMGVSIGTAPDNIGTAGVLNYSSTAQRPTTPSAAGPDADPEQAVLDAINERLGVGGRIRMKPAMRAAIATAISAGWLASEIAQEASIDWPDDVRTRFGFLIRRLSEISNGAPPPRQMIKSSAPRCEHGEVKVAINDGSGCQLCEANQRAGAA